MIEAGIDSMRAVEIDGGAARLRLWECPLRLMLVGSSRGWNWTLERSG